jgi:lipid II:glycine glycyltransferase (peptidoglycan interpeptide bridge formation enzyme)
MPDLSIRTLDESEYPVWDSFVASSPQGTIFNTSLWASIIREVFGIQHTIYGVLDGSQLVGGISLFHKKKAGLSVATQVPLTPYNGILFHPPEGEKSQKTSTERQEIMRVLLERLEKEFKFVDLVLHPSVYDMRPFVWRHWQTLPQYTHVNSLTDLTHTWTLLSSSLRRKISRAEEKQIKVVEKDDPALLLKFQEMSYAKAHLKPVLSIPVFQQYCENVKRAGLLRIFSAVDLEANVHAERAVIVHKDQAYDWIAGTNFQIEDEHGNQLLVWEILKRLSGEGVQTFDFLGANTLSITEFKRAFGGKFACYFEVRYFSSPLVRALDSLNQWRLRLKRKA